MLRFRWSGLRRCYGDGAVVIDEAIVGAAPWRWWTGRLNRRDNEMDEDPHLGRWTRDVELLWWTTSSGKRLWLGSGDVADGGGWGFATGVERLWRPGMEGFVVGAALVSCTTPRLKQDKRDNEQR